MFMWGGARRSTMGAPSEAAAILLTWRHGCDAGARSCSELGLLPPPLAGEGWGEGEHVGVNRVAFLKLVAWPLPIPPPQAGEGIHRARGLMIIPRQMKLL